MAATVKPSRRILGAVKDSLLKREPLRARHSNYYLQEDVFTRGKKLPVPRQSVQVTRPTIMAFADDAPLFNWAHSCVISSTMPKPGNYTGNSGAISALFRRARYPSELSGIP